VLSGDSLDSMALSKNSSEWCAWFSGYRSATNWLSTDWLAEKKKKKKVSWWMTVMVTCVVAFWTQKVPRSIKLSWWVGGNHQKIKYLIEILLYTWRMANFCYTSQAIEDSWELRISNRREPLRERGGRLSWDADVVELLLRWDEILADRWMKTHC
jgi:hypothetical protein